MKKFLPILILFFLLTGTLSAQQLATLDEVIKSAARGVEEVLPQRTLVAVINFASPAEAFSDYVIEELTGELVMGRKVTIVDRRSLALIRQELNLQMSGDVSDESAQAIGRMLGAQSIVSGSLTDMGTSYRFRVRVIDVETAAIRTQVSLNLQKDAQVTFLLSGNLPSTQPPTTTGTAPTTPSTSAQPSAPITTTPPIEGTPVPGNSLAAKFTWLETNAQNNGEYILEVNANETLRPQIWFSGRTNITIHLKGIGTVRTISLSSNGSLFTIPGNNTMILEENIILKGKSDNNAPLVVANGTLILNAGSTITGNSNNTIASNGGGVSGTVIMNGGTITDNTSRYSSGGGVSGTVIMNGGTITGNTANGYFGGGVYGTIIMNGGIISGNTASSGGGVSGTLTMNDGNISGNTASYRGGGVYGAVTMRGGTISGNTARDSGGGIYIDGTFTKIGGSITSFADNPIRGNAVKNDTNVIQNNSGHAVFVSSSVRKETTAGPDVNLSYRDSRNVSGDWDN